MVSFDFTSQKNEVALQNTEHRRAKVNLSLSFDSEHGDTEIKGRNAIAVRCLIIQLS